MISIITVWVFVFCQPHFVVQSHARVSLIWVVTGSVGTLQGKPVHWIRPCHSLIPADRAPCSQNPGITNGPINSNKSNIMLIIKTIIWKYVSFRKGKGRGKLPVECGKSPWVWWLRCRSQSQGTGDPPADPRDPPCTNRRHGHSDPRHR